MSRLSRAFLAIDTLSPSIAGLVRSLPNFTSQAKSIPRIFPQQPRQYGGARRVAKSSVSCVAGHLRRACRWSHHSSTSGAVSAATAQFTISRRPSIRNQYQGDAKTSQWQQYKCDVVSTFPCECQTRPLHPLTCKNEIKADQVHIVTMVNCTDAIFAVLAGTYTLLNTSA
jgi:hypothetical protein